MSGTASRCAGKASTDAEEEDDNAREADEDGDDNKAAGGDSAGGVVSEDCAPSGGDAEATEDADSEAAEEFRW
jgi:hypothetical protein